MISTAAILLSPSLSILSNAALRAKSLMLESLYLAISKSLSPSPMAIKRCLSFYSEIKLSIFAFNIFIINKTYDMPFIIPFNNIY